MADLMDQINMFTECDNHGVERQIGLQLKVTFKTASINTHTKLLEYITEFLEAETHLHDDFRIVC